LNVTGFLVTLWHKRKHVSLSSYHWRYVLNDSAHGNTISLMKRGNKFETPVTSK